MLQYNNINRVVQSWIRGTTAVAIAASVERAVHAGTLGAGQALPTIRALAARLRVSPVTVAAAYRLLRARGLVAGDGRRGTRIRPSHPTPAVRAAESRVAEGVVDLATGNPDALLLPPLDSALRDTLGGGAALLYGDVRAVRPFIAFAAGEFAADGIPSNAITVLSGALDAIERILREHLRAGDAVGVEDPTLPALLDLLAASALTTEPFAIDDEGPQPDAFERALRRGVRAVIITPRAQNPTGAALTRPRAAELLRLLRRHPRVLVIENDPLGPVAGVSSVTMCDGGRVHWAVVRSTSKFLGPDLRVAVVAGDALTIARVEARHALGMRWVSHVLQHLALSLWSDPSAGRQLARATVVYAQRRAAVVAALAARGITAGGRSGFNVWIPVREETATVQALADRGWAVAAGERFRLRSEPAIRVTTAALAMEDAPRFAADLAASTRGAAAALA
jgi:DNA-binding transcriptional MocR family regulator